LRYVLTPGMLGAAVTVVIGGFLIARLNLSWATSLAIALVKATLPLLYFVFFFKGQWFMIDDYEYQRLGEITLASGYTPWTLISTYSGRTLLVGLTNGQVVYPWWNAFGQWLFGRDYWAAVFLNVLLTFVAGYFTARTLEDLGFPRRYVKGCLVFFLLHAEVLAWSSIINMKDFVVLAFSSIALRSLIVLAKLYQGRSSYALSTFLRKAATQLTVFAVMCVGFRYIRFYVPFLLLVALGAWAFLSLPIRWRVAILVAAPLAFRWVMRSYQHLASFLEPSGLLFGLLRFPLTPRPWSIQPNYTFLLLPSVLHWVFFVPTVFAAIALWVRVPLARIPILYLLTTIAFFAVIPEVQGPRHRVQVLPLFAWLEFHAMWLAFAATDGRAERLDAALVAHA